MIGFHSEKNVRGEQAIEVFSGARIRRGEENMIFRSSKIWGRGGGGGGAWGQHALV